MTLRCIIWAAVSTPQQAQDQKESIPAQVEQARQVTTQKGWQEVADPLIVPGQSRNINWLDQAMKEIPAMQELISLADARKIDLVIVRDWDRLARTESLRVQISTRLREQGVQVYSINQPVEPHENFQSQSDTALMVEGMSGILGEIENRLRVRRWRMGMLGRVKRGLWPGGAVAPYGYRYDQEKGILIANPKEAKVVQFIFHLATEGLSTHKITRELNLQGHKPSKASTWSSPCVRKILRGPSYLGLVPFDGQLYPGQHEALIKRDTWESVQVLLDRRRTLGGRASASRNVLAGLLRCGHCGRAMWGHQVIKKSGFHLYYKCSQHYFSGDTQCRPNLHRQSEVMEALMHQLSNYLTQEHLDKALEQSRARQFQEHTQEKETTIETLTSMDKRRQRQFRAYELGEITLQEYAEYRGTLETEAKELRIRPEQIEERLQRRVNIAGLQDMIRDVLQGWRELPPSTLKAKLASFIETIALYEDGTLTITHLE